MTNIKKAGMATLALTAFTLAGCHQQTMKNSVVVTKSTRTPSVNGQIAVAAAAKRLGISTQTYISENAVIQQYLAKQGDAGQSVVEIWGLAKQVNLLPSQYLKKQRWLRN